MTTIGSGTGFNRVFNGSQGQQVNRMLDALGLPDHVGDLIGARIDMARGDMQGALRNLQDLTSGLSTQQMDGLFGKGLPSAGFVPRPMAHLATAFGAGLGAGVGAAVGGLPGALAGGILGGAAGRIIGRGFNPFGSVRREAPFGTGFVGRSVERQIRNNPFFKAQMERALGGRIIADGRNDGKLTVYRPPFSQLGGVLRNAFQAATLPQVGIAAALGGLAIPMAGALAANAVTGGILGGLQRMEANIASFAKGIEGQGKGQLANDPQTRAMADGMGIDLKNASFEDVLFLLLMKYAKNKEEDIMNKVKDLDKSIQEGGKKDGGGKGGLLGSVGGILGGIVGGPVGSMIGGAAGNAVSGLMSGGGVGGQAGSNGSYGMNMGEKADYSKMSDTMKQQMLQKLMGDLTKLYEMLSNMIKSMHDMQMTPVRNLRG